MYTFYDFTNSVLIFRNPLLDHSVLCLRCIGILCILRLMRHVKRGGDKIIPPTQFMELKRIKQLACSSPEIRQEMISSMKTRVLGGRYRINAERVAEKIVQCGVYIVNALEG